MSGQFTRREFIKSAGIFSACAAMGPAAWGREKQRPNILWITSEDNGPELGCYGDDYADSPNIDSIAARGMIYERAWSTAPVCAPARTTIITGVYPPSTGSQHMRSQVKMPPFMKMYPQFLREAGYYCTNNSKEDYNLAKPGKVWDESSRKAHWRNRANGRPFFAIFNFTTSHESQIRKRPHKAVHDPAEAPVPAYHPDTPEVRQDWAQYYDKVTEMDQRVGRVLQELKEDGLEDNTIIFYYGDHGSGMPRSKRWPYNSGLHVPMIVHFPEKWKHLAPKEYQTGGKSERLVGFVDLAPTLLSITGIQPPSWMQGKAFAGKYQTEPPRFMFGFRGRMDERYDMVRSVTDGRYIYIRHYKPHKIYGQYIQYMFQTPTTRVWKELYDRGKLNEAQSRFWEKKEPEELYDLVNDPDEVHNLARSPEHQDIRKRLRQAQQDWAVSIHDLGFLPEDEIHSRAEGSTPYEMGHDRNKYPMEKIMAAAETASMLDMQALPKLIRAMDDQDSAVRYWAALGILMREETGVRETRRILQKTMKTDPSPSVRVIAAQALGQYGNDEDASAVVDALVGLADMNKHSVFVSMLAFNALDAMDERAKHAKARIEQLPARPKNCPPRVGGYCSNLKKKTLADLR